MFDDGLCEKLKHVDKVLNIHKLCWTVLYV